MRSKNQKLKLLYLAKIMREQTDDEHALTMPEIIEELSRYGIKAERKSIYDDIEALNDYGIEIIKEQCGSKTHYHCGSREFERTELHIIIDAIASSKFITAKKSKQLIRKLEDTMSLYDKKLLERNVYVSGRVKNMNESIFYTVDVIQNAIANNHRIQFQYFSWNMDKEMELRRDGAYYDVSPWALVWNDENYYMVGYDGEEKKLKHYRVDKMLKACETDEKRQGRSEFQLQNKEKYTEKHFRMFSGKEETVTLLCKKEMANVILDHFGRDVYIQKLDEEHFRARVDVAVSNQFFGWVFALGGNVAIESPQSVKKQMREMTERFLQNA